MCYAYAAWPQQSQRYVQGRRTKSVSGFSPVQFAFRRQAQLSVSAASNTHCQSEPESTESIHIHIHIPHSHSQSDLATCIAGCHASDDFALCARVSVACHSAVLCVRMHECACTVRNNCWQSTKVKGGEQSSECDEY